MLPYNFQKMKKTLLPLLLSVFFLLPAKAQVFVEAEEFESYGRWSLDQQFIGTMGSAYLLAHGAGVPVGDAKTYVAVPEKGRYHVYVRTFNWTSPFAEGPGPGRFSLSVDGTRLGDALGDRGTSWGWQEAGTIKLGKGSHELRITDLTGLEGRFDAVCLSRKALSSAELDRLITLKREGAPVVDGGTYDLVVVGAGYSGICAAVAAARKGLSVALIQDRAVLGGNNSSEIRVQLGGSIECEPYPNLGNLLKEFAPTEKGNAMPPSYYGDEAKRAIVDAEPNIKLFTLTRVTSVEKEGDLIRSVTGTSVVTGEKRVFRAPLFADCTGDGTVGFLAGADYRVGRESRSEYGESSAPEEADIMVLGASLQWSSKKDAEPSSFPEFTYGIELSDESCQKMTKGSWTWETGMFSDQILEAERIRDYGMLAIYANWSYLKNHSPYRAEFARRSLDWVSFNSGKRESRRLIGDYVLNQNDIEHNVMFPDGSASTSWGIDIHYPEPENSRYFPGREFKSVCDQEEVPVTPIPYRCFYSRNIGNLFMAGRDISVTHVALASVRVMRTCAMMGEVVGLAASVCHEKNCLPRGVYTDYLPELQALMRKGAGKKGLPNTQMTNVGRNAHHFFEKPIIHREIPSVEPDNSLLERIRLGDLAIDMVFVEGGTFMMGADGRAEFTHECEKPSHEVTLSPYYIGRYEVTNSLWCAVMGGKLSPGSENLPVARKTLSEIREFIAKLNSMTGREFRLPTEAEWEFAARGGNRSRGYLFSGSDDFAEVAWMQNTSSGETRPVGSLLPNELGIYDMSGNVWELCSDWFAPYSAAPATDPDGPSDGSYVVLRGGAIFSGENACRVSYRSYDSPRSALVINGFRLAETKKRLSAEQIAVIDRRYPNDADCYGGLLFQFHSQNQHPEGDFHGVTVADLKDGTERKFVNLGFNENFHNSSITFSGKKASRKDPFPLLYASENYAPTDYYKITVYRIGEDLVPVPVQTIEMPDPHALGILYPHAFLDEDGKHIWIEAYSSDKKETVFFRFLLPKYRKGSTVALGPYDRSFRIPKKKVTDQAICMHGGKFYQVVGVSREAYLRIIDPSESRLIDDINLVKNGFPYEPEAVFFNGDKLCISFSSKGKALVYEILLLQ